jgi:broad specificity phosphatase PhoE
MIAVMRHLYFVRHGLSEMNVLGMYSGSTDTLLTDTGKDQAKKTGAHIRDNQIPIDIIVSSPLSRAHETAKHIATEIDYEHDEIIIHDGLVERHFGILEGSKSQDGPVDYQTYRSDPFAIDHIEDVEKITDLQYRANKVLREIRELPHDSVLIVSHGAFGRALERAVKNMPLTEYGTTLDNAQIVKLI